MLLHNADDGHAAQTLQWSTSGKTVEKKGLEEEGISLPITHAVNESQHLPPHRMEALDVVSFELHLLEALNGISELYWELQDTFCHWPHLADLGDTHS